MAKPAQTWGAYLRISEDPNDLQRGVTRQREDAAAAIARLGGDPDVVRWYVENDTSAYKKKRIKVTDPTGREYFGYRVVRPVWHEALHDLREGTIAALAVYDLDRLARDPRDLEDAIETVEHYGATIVSATSADTNLATESGRAMARFMVTMANKSSADTARRVRRAHLASAQQGKAVGGRRPFGYQEDKVTIRESEAALIREAAADVLNGVRLETIARRWNDAGVTSVMGGVWTGGKLLQLLRSPRIAGWRVHRVGGSPWTPVPPIALDKDGNPVRGEWEPIIDDATHRALVARLTNKTERRKRVPRRNIRRFMMTGLLRCAECGGLMYANQQGKNHYYRCDGMKTGACTNSASGRGVDGWVAERVIERSELIAANRGVAEPQSNDRLRELNEQIDATDEMIEDIMSAYRAKQIAGRVAFANASKLEEARDAALAERDELEAELASTGPEAVDSEKWETWDTDRRRAACERVLEAVYVRRAPSPTGNRFDTGRLDPVWK